MHGLTPRGECGRGEGQGSEVMLLPASASRDPEVRGIPGVGPALCGLVYGKIRRLLDQFILNNLLFWAKLIKFIVCRAISRAAPLSSTQLVVFLSLLASPLCCCRLYLRPV